MSLKAPELAASPLAGLTYGSPHKRPRPLAQPRLALATTRSIAIVEKLGQGRAGFARNPAPKPDHAPAPRRAIQRQFAPTPWTPVLPLLPVGGLRSLSASGPIPSPSKRNRPSGESQSQSARRRPARRR